MNKLIELSISKPIAVIALVMMVILFGYVALTRIPIQMAPDVRQPVIIVETSWRGASPTEIEREIVNRQEEELKGLEGLKKITSRSQHNSGEVTLEFTPGLNLDRALLLVANRLDRVSGYPEEADEPTLETSGTDDNAIAWFIVQRLAGNTTEITTYSDFIEDIAKERLERIPGVATVNVFGFTERELRIIVDPQKLAQYRITVTEMVNRLRSENAAITGGDIKEGKRHYVVRTEGDLNSVDRVNAVVLRTGAGERGSLGRVTVADVADVVMGYKTPTTRARGEGVRSMAFNITREQGANVIKVMEEVKQTIQELKDGAFRNSGLTVQQVYDETNYIQSSVDLVIQNIYVGGILAVIILLLFLRSWRPTLVIGLAIPVSVIGSFVAMALLGRSLNVVSLAGIAFAVGMVVDAAIVVLENIFRLRQEGRSRVDAAYNGAAQVWPAVLVSALTTVMVFIPILIMELEAGQLFRDIAVAISVSVTLSLIVSVTLIPALSKYLLSGKISKSTEMRKLPGLDHFAAGFTALWVRYARNVVQNKKLAIGVVGGITVLAGVFTWTFAPKLDYLPTGNRNFILGFIIPPAGYSIDAVEGITKKVQEATRPYWQSNKDSELSEEERVFERFFYVAFKGRGIIAGAAHDPDNPRELIPLLQGPFQGPNPVEPETIAVVFQPSLFGRSIGSGRNIDIEIYGNDLEQIYDVARQVFFRTMPKFSPSEGNRIRPNPALSLGEPEKRVIPDRVKLSDNGVTARELGDTIDALNDGLRIAEITVGSKRIDLTLMGQERTDERTQDIDALPVVTRDGRIVPVESLADISVTRGPTEILRSERIRAVQVQVTPRDDVPLQEAAERIQAEIVQPLLERGLPDGVGIRLAGAVDKLAETWNEMVLDLVLALIIVFLVMAILFESFTYPLIVMLTVPIAAAGGILGLALLNLFVNQPLDMLTMLGFVILTGIVVNNAILLVHQTLHHIREDNMNPDDAIELATRNRIRPIFMSTLTSVFGMLPLVVFPGSGSELYRGLGSVVVGGLSLSAVLTMAVVPPMMSLTISYIERRKEEGAGQTSRQSAPAE